MVNIKVFYLDDTFNYQTTFWAYATVNASCRTEKKKCFSSRRLSRPFFFFSQDSTQINQVESQLAAPEGSVNALWQKKCLKFFFFFTIFIYRILLIGYAACLSECCFSS